MARGTEELKGMNSCTLSWLTIPNALCTDGLPMLHNIEVILDTICSQEKRNTHVLAVLSCWVIQSVVVFNV